MMRYLVNDDDLEEWYEILRRFQLDRPEMFWSVEYICSQMEGIINNKELIEILKREAKKGVE